MSESIKLRCWEVKRTDKAICVSTTPAQNRDGKLAWVPLSLLDHISSDLAPLGEWKPVTITMPEWIATQKGLL